MTRNTANHTDSTHLRLPHPDISTFRVGKGDGQRGKLEGSTQTVYTRVFTKTLHHTQQCVRVWG